MYPYNAQNTTICYDSSPFFSEKPSTIICTGYPFKYNPNAVDPELDSLVYSWGQPLDDDFKPVIPFSPGYNVNSVSCHQQLRTLRMLEPPSIPELVKLHTPLSQEDISLQ
jgi:hypothetical protein